MKQKVNTLIILILTIGFFNAKRSNLSLFDDKVAIINFETEIIDYGTIKQYSDGTKAFTFINEGDAPLTITRVKTSCGCTVASYPKTPILPGETGEINIAYDTKRLGNFTKTITVMSNAQKGNKILKIKGKIVAIK